METIAKADIFFVVTTIAVVLVTIGIIAVLVQAYRIARDIRSVSEKIAASGDAIASDIAALRSGIKRGAKKIVANITGLSERWGKKKSARKEKPLSNNQ